MSIQKTIFGVAAPYQKQKYDGTLRLERAPDLSEQASREHLANVEQLQLQYNIDKAARDLENDIAEDIAKNRVPPANTLLSKLAPFSDIIKTQLEAADKGFDEWRDKQATDDARRKIRFQEVFGMSQEVLEATWTQPTIDKLRENPEYDALFTSNVFSNDPGLQRRRGTAKVKLLTQSADNMWEKWSNDPNTKITVHDGQGGTREISPFQVTSAAEAEASLRAWDLHVDSFFADDPEGVQQEARDALRKKRGKFSEQLYKTVRSVTAQRALGNFSQALYAGAPSQMVLQGMAQVGELEGGRGRIGHEKAMDYFYDDFTEGYKSGHFNKFTVQAWKQEGSGFYKNGKEQTMAERYPKLFTKIDNFIAQEDQNIFTRFQTNNKQMAEMTLMQFSQVLAQPGVALDDREIDHYDAVLNTYQVYNHPLIKKARESFSVSSLQKDKFEELMTKRYERGFYYQSEAEFEAAFVKFPELKSKFAKLDKLYRENKSGPQNANYTTSSKALQMWSTQAHGNLQVPDSGGASLKLNANGGVKSAEGVIIQAELEKRFQAEVRAMLLSPIDGEVVINGIGQTTKQNYYEIARDRTQMWFRSEMLRKGGKFEFKNGTYPNLIRQVQHAGTNLVITRQQQNQLNQNLGKTFNTFLSAATGKHGTTGNALNKALADPEMLSILYSDKEKEEAILRFQRGLPPTAKTATILSFPGMYGNRVNNYQTLINTLAGKEILSEHPGYKTYSEIKANVSLDPYIAYLERGMNGTTAQQRRAQLQARWMDPTGQVASSGQVAPSGQVEPSGQAPVSSQVTTPQTAQPTRTENKFHEALGTQKEQGFELDSIKEMFRKLLKDRTQSWTIRQLQKLADTKPELSWLKDYVNTPEFKAYLDELSPQP